MTSENPSRQLYIDELNDYYDKMPVDIAEIKEVITNNLDQMVDASSYAKKAMIHDVMAKQCYTKVFKYFPFFFELEAGRTRYDWALRSPLGNLMDNNAPDNWHEEYYYHIKKYIDRGLVHGYRPVGFDHHCPGYDNVLSDGIQLIISKAAERLSGETDLMATEFLKATISSCYSLLNIAEKFSNTAAEMAQKETDLKAKDNLLKIAHAAKRVPAYPAGSFYEALCCILFIRELYGTLEGYGMSTLGHLDRLLYPYYKNDCENGVIDYNDAKELIHALVAYTDVKFNLSFESHETSTTIIIGGCDANGETVYNDVTDMILDAFEEGLYFGTKLNARISEKHPARYIERLGAFIDKGLTVLVIQNDDVLIPAHVRQGKAESDARLYVSGGCHEIVLANTEINTRADTWINVPGLMLEVINSGIDYPSFDSLYKACICKIKKFHDIIVEIKNQYERIWPKYNPAPMFSASICDCIDKAKDVPAGGARYNSVSLSMVGAATFIDSLFALNELIYKSNKFSFDEIRNMLINNFDGREDVLYYIRNNIPKYGTNHAEVNSFAAMVLEDISGCSGQTNARGGKYLPAFYPHDLYITMGIITGATPDGRHANDVLSRGCSPSEFVTTAAVTDIINSLSSIDFTSFDESFVCDLTLPYTNNNVDPSILQAIIKTFMKVGGSSIQINKIDSKALIEARENPNLHRDIVVRVCGYSRLFCYLPDTVKDEIINRTVRNR